VVHAAIGGSTNALLQLPEIAREAGVEVTIDDFDRIHREVPVLADVTTTGRYPAEYFWYAGGVPALMLELRDLLHLDCITVTEDVLATPGHARAHRSGKSLRGRARGYRCSDRAEDKAGRRHGHPLRGAARQRHARDVLRRRDPVIRPGAKPHDRDRDDGRYSGAMSGPCIGHVAPEALDGGPIALVEENDLIELNVPERRLAVVGVDGRPRPEDEMTTVLAGRRARWSPRPRRHTKGILSLYERISSDASHGASLLGNGASDQFTRRRLARNGAAERKWRQHARRS
jgi:dihydroxyacid dehydratase/phosphogluconate dehydratase